MDSAKELSIPEHLTGFSEEDREAHNKAVQKLRESLTEYSQHCASLSQYEHPVDDIVLVLAAALGKERLPELVDAVAEAACKMEDHYLAFKLGDLAHDAYIRQPHNVKDQLGVVAEELKLTAYGISQKITGNAGVSSPQRRRVEVRWQRWLNGDGLKTIENLEADLSALGYELRVFPK
jgi:hypothetical protein